jgi:hypothetical protein
LWGKFATAEIGILVLAGTCKKMWLENSIQMIQIFTTYAYRSTIYNGGFKSL